MYNQMEKPGNADSRKVVLRLMSNWGHESRVGLTGIELFDCRGDRVPVSAASVVVEGARGQQGDLITLFDGKCKVQHTSQSQ